MSFPAIGTKWSISTKLPIATSEWSTIEDAVKDCISSFDKSFSRFREDSWVRNVFAKPGTHQLPQHSYELLQFYEKLYQATEGLITPLIGQAMEAAGYDAQYSLVTKELTTPADWDSVLHFDNNSLTTTQPVLLDFGAAGKGYLIDLIHDLLQKHGLRSYIIDASGDILHRDLENKPITVGLENPLDVSQVIGTIDLGNQSLCASAGSRRKWGSFHHIINPATLQSPREVLATWVTAQDTMTADGIATALFFTPARKLSRAFQFEYAILTSDMSLSHSPHLSINPNQ